ncbi:carbon-nitrogen hydrolase family protein [soil metagenome]
MIVRVAAVQASPVFLDLAATLEKTLAQMADAAALGANLVVFPETWLPGYPAWLDVCPGAALWDSAAAKAVFARLRRNSVVIPGPVTEALAKAAKKHGVTVSIGVHERCEAGPGRGTLYNTMLLFDEAGQLRITHRKLMPTYTEKLLWGLGDGSGLEAATTSSAGRVGGLICWEHWMPLARQAMHNSGEDIHIAAWPTAHNLHQLASRHYAFEGGCFVVASGGMMRAKDLPPELERTADLIADPEKWILRGGSAIIAPDTSYVTEPIFDQETIVIGDCDLARVEEARLTLDVAGHYARPDVLEFRVKPQENWKS